jgi:hypothetical protein
LNQVFIADFRVRCHEVRFYLISGSIYANRVASNKNESVF